MTGVLIDIENDEVYEPRLKRVTDDDTYCSRIAIPQDLYTKLYQTEVQYRQARMEVLDYIKANPDKIIFPAAIEPESDDDLDL